MNFWQSLFSGDGFMPRRYCGDWSSSLITLHVVSDVIIWLSYLWIPMVMLWAYRTNGRQLEIPRAVRFLLLLYVAFITACGFTHFFDALMFWDPVYRINGIVRGLTALVSLATAISLVRLVPLAITAPITIRAQKSLLDQQQIWLRDILDSATDGVLRLCAALEDLPKPLGVALSTIEVTESQNLATVRRMVRELAIGAGFDALRTDDLVTATHEATMNALVHAGNGTVTGYADPDTVQIWVSDQGGGIPLDRLPIATLKQGYSTAGSAGQGWFQLLTFVDSAYLFTGSEGTTLVLTMNRAAPSPVIPFSERVGGNVAVPKSDTV